MQGVLVLWTLLYHVGQRAALLAIDMGYLDMNINPFIPLASLSVAPPVFVTGDVQCLLQFTVCMIHCVHLEKHELLEAIGTSALEIPRVEFVGC